MTYQRAAPYEALPKPSLQSLVFDLGVIWRRLRRPLQQGTRVDGAGEARVRVSLEGSGREDERRGRRRSGRGRGRSRADVQRRARHVRAQCKVHRRVFCYADTLSLKRAVQ